MSEKAHRLFERCRRVAACFVFVELLGKGHGRAFTTCKDSDEP